MGGIGLVFSGGIAKGAYEVGFCKAMEELVSFEQVTAIAASSIGTINAYAYATHQIDKLSEVWKATDFKNMHEFYQGLVKRPVIFDAIDVFAKEQIDHRLPLIITCIQVPMIHVKYIDITPVSDSDRIKLLKAAISIPSLMSPIEVGGKKYVDGAVLDNTPVKALRTHKLDVIFVLRFDHSAEDYSMISKDTEIIEVVFQDEHFMKNSFALDKKSSQLMMENGYKEGIVFLEKALRFGIKDKEYMKYIAASYNRGAGCRIIPKNGDDIIRRINKLSKLFPT